MKHNERPLHFLFYFIPVCILTLGGLLVSIYLSFSHYKVYTDIEYSSFCAISKAINCDTVSQSPYSILWGLPLSVWGVVGYTFLLLFLPYGYKKDRINLWSLFLITSGVFSVYSLYLAFISAFYIHSYCLMCLLTYAVNFSLLFYSWIIIKRFNPKGFKHSIVSDFAFIKTNAKTILPLCLFLLLGEGMLYMFTSMLSQ